MAAVDDPTVPYLALLGVQKEAGEQDFNGRSIAFADFSQNGTYDTALVASTMYKGVYTDGSNPGMASDSPAKLYFVQRQPDGTWRDITSRLLPDLSQRYTCVSPGFIAVADFNGDGRPDAFLGCTGPDYPIVSAGNAFLDLSPQYVVLSQPDGTYQVKRVNIDPIYAHQVAAVDLDGDGKVDVLSTDASGAPGGHRKPVVLWGRGDGSFTADYTVFPDETQDKAIFNVLAIPVGGVNHVLLSGFPTRSIPGMPSNWDGAYGTKVLRYTGGKLVVVNDLTPGIPMVARTGLPYGMLFDAIYRDGFLYTLRIEGDYGGEAYIRTDFATGLDSTLLFARQTGAAFGSGSPGNLKITSDNRLRNMVAGCNAREPLDFGYQTCNLSIPLGP